MYGLSFLILELLDWKVYLVTSYYFSHDILITCIFKGAFETLFL